MHGIWLALGTVYGLQPTIEVEATSCDPLPPFVQELEARLQEIEAPAVHVYVGIEPTASEQIRVEVRTTVGALNDHRSFLASSCASALDAAALVAAISIDALHKETTQPTTQTPPPQTHGASSTAAQTEIDGTVPPPAKAQTAPGDVERPAEATAPASAAPPDDNAAHAVADKVEVRSQVSASAAVSVGHVPGVSALIEAGAGVVLGPIVLQLSGLHVVSGRQAIRDMGGEVEVDLWGGSVRAQFELRWPKWSLPLHLGVILAGQRGQGFDITGARRSTGFYGAMRGGTGVRWSPHRVVALGADASATLAFSRPRFGLQSQSASQEVYRSPILGFLGAFVVELRLP